MSELFSHIEVFGKDVINYLNDRILLAEKLEYENTKYLEECKKTIVALNQINKIINNELILFYTSLTTKSLDKNFNSSKARPVTLN